MLTALEFQHFVDRDLAETQLFVELAAPLVRCGDLEGDSVGSPLLRPLLDAREEGPANAEVPVGLLDEHVVYGSPGLLTEGRRALPQLARDEADRAIPGLCDEEEGMAAARQVGEEASHHPLGARSGGVDLVVGGVFFSTLHPESGRLR